MPALRLENRDVALRRRSLWRSAPFVAMPLALALGIVSPSTIVLGIYVVLGAWIGRLQTANRVAAWSGPHACWGIAGETIHERIVRAMHSGGSQSSPASLELLDRNGLSIAEWRARLTRLFESAMGAGYRSVSIERDAVAAVLGDSEAPPERRIAAAIALAGSGGPAAEERVRIAIDACANDRLRVAMSKVLGGDLDEDDVDAATALAAPTRGAPRA